MSSSALMTKAFSSDLLFLSIGAARMRWRARRNGRPVTRASTRERQPRSVLSVLRRAIRRCRAAPVISSSYRFANCHAAQQNSPACRSARFASGAALLAGASLTLFVSSSTGAALRSGRDRSLRRAGERSRTAAVAGARSGTGGVLGGAAPAHARQHARCAPGAVFSGADRAPGRPAAGARESSAHGPAAGRQVRALGRRRVIWFAALPLLWGACSSACRRAPRPLMRVSRR